MAEKELAYISSYMKKSNYIRGKRPFWCVSFARSIEENEKWSLWLLASIFPLIYKVLARKINSDYLAIRLCKSK